MLLKSSEIGGMIKYSLSFDIYNTPLNLVEVLYFFFVELKVLLVVNVMLDENILFLAYSFNSSF